MTFPICDRVLHELVKYNAAVWLRLHLLGFQDDGEGGILELRNCDICNSTLARPVPQLNAHPKHTELQTDNEQERNRT